MKKIILLLIIILLPACGTQITSVTNTPIPATSTPTPLPTASHPVPFGMIHVPPGEFLMGSTEAQIKTVFEQCKVSPSFLCKASWYENELPQHMVYLDEFFIDIHEVTNAQYVEFLNREGNQTEGERAWLNVNSNFTLIEEKVGKFEPKAGFADHPVVMVTWYGAKAYCTWQGKRLPTEAEWEKAARGTDGRIYPWGNSVDDDKANYNWKIGQTTKVGIYSAGISPYGVYDMAGNASEWTQDCYDKTYYQNNQADRNPVNNECSGPERRSVRGGSAYGFNTHIRSVSRMSEFPAKATTNTGFRCALTP